MCFCFANVISSSLFIQLRFFYQLFVNHSLSKPLKWVWKLPLFNLYFILFFVPIFLLLPRQNIFSYIDYNVVLNQWRGTVNVREGNAGDIYTSIQKIIKVFPYVTTIAELLSTIPKIRNDFSTAKGGLFVLDI